MATNSPLNVAQPATASGQKGKQSNGALAISCDIMDDLASRFIINVPEEERKNLIRICFQMELAHWFYLDFYCADSKQKCGMKQFAQQMFKHVPFLQPHWTNVDSVLEDWKQYKLTVPTYGAILLSEDMRHVLLVQSYWAKSSWGFPKGKINENEEPVNCAIREVYEETGYDIRKLIIPTEYIEVNINYQFTRLYLVPGVPLETVFVPKTRNEIKCCEWFPVDLLPVTKHASIVKDNHNLSGNSFFMILPFVKRLKKWLDSYHSGKGAGKGKGTMLLHQANNSPVLGRESTGKQQQQGQKQQQRQRHKSMGELQQPHPPIQILQRGKGMAVGTPNAHQQSVATNSTANRTQQQQQNQTPRDDPYRSQRAASVANESNNEFRFGIGEAGSATASGTLQMPAASHTNEHESRPSLSTTSNGGRTERVVASQTKRKLFANELNPPDQTQPTAAAAAEADYTRQDNETDDETDEYILDWIYEQKRMAHLKRDVVQWVTWGLDAGPFVIPKCTGNLN
ncbi:m7GpppN-mRNA hydrolase [Anopheles maculipalpis]|uniref:m7GpppN-mRNA hydrolase n=1 Tax=Anopheles maculipalpis TaxID=1496333 RepID=UPI002158FC9B|nr:m7GpppN-mRNA hydrolase [Anopheles maculipalpis]